MEEAGGAKGDDLSTSSPAETRNAAVLVPVKPTEVIDIPALMDRPKDISTADPAELLTWVKKVVLVIKTCWLLVMPAIERIQREKLWKRESDQDGQQKYLRWSDFQADVLFPFGRPATLNQKSTAWRYLKRTEKSLAASIEMGCETHKFLRLDYRALAELNALERQVENGQIERHEYAALHRQYVGGDLAGAKLLERAVALKAAAGKEDPEEEHAAERRADDRTSEAKPEQPEQPEQQQPEAQGSDTLLEVPESEDEPGEQRLVEPSSKVQEVPEPVPPGDQPEVPESTTVPWSRDALLVRGLKVLEREARTPDSPQGPALGNFLKPLVMLRAVVEVLLEPVEGSDPLEHAFKDYKRRLAGTSVTTHEHHREYVGALLERVQAAVSPAEVEVEL